MYTDYKVELKGKPLIPDVEAGYASHPQKENESGTGRDMELLDLLWERLKSKRIPDSAEDFPAKTPINASNLDPDRDLYEPQRLNRKICWTYNQSAKKVPLLRRHYI